jgi:LacI family transcriptional regulator, gluconate utilization system Gnt-I transcriptional repressor
MPEKQAVRSRATGRVTLADVAHAAQVSPITVSRALSGKRSVAPELVERVRIAAKRLGYVPDPAARALASRHSSHVAVLIPLLTNALFVELLEAVQRDLRLAGFQTLIGITHYDASEEEQLLREQLVHRPAGMLITGFQHTEATWTLIEESRVPCVHLMELSRQTGSYCVGFSQEDAGAAMARHLLDRGHKRIAFAAAQLDPRTLQRMEGWRRELQRAGAYDPRLEWLNPAPSSQILGGMMLEQIVGQSPPVDAVFFCNDDLAQGALLAATRLGIAVPDRIAIAGFNDLPGSSQMIPPLTTVQTPRGRIGEEASRMLLSLIRGEPVAQHAIDVGFSLIARGST